MMTFQFDNKGVQTDPYIPYTRYKLLNTLQTYIIAVNRYRLHLFNQYIQSNESHENQDLFYVRKEILNRFQWVIIELEQVIENLQIHQISVTDAQQSIDQPLIKEVIETSLNADFPSINNRKQIIPNTDEWQMYRRDLQEIKEDLYMLDLLVHRGILKIDRLVNFTNPYV